MGVSRVLGALGVGGRAASPIVAVRLLGSAAAAAAAESAVAEGSPAAVLHCVTLSEDSSLRLWAVGPGAVGTGMGSRLAESGGGGGGGASVLLRLFPPIATGGGDDAAAAATGPPPALAVWTQGPLVALLVHAGGFCCAHLGRTDDPGAMRSLTLSEPQPMREARAAAAPCALRGLAVLPDLSTSGLALWLCYGGDGYGPSLWRASVAVEREEAGPWEQAQLEAAEETRLAADDGLPRAAPPLAAAPAQPTASASSFLLGRILEPARFAPRHRRAAALALLPPPADSDANGGAPRPPLRAAVARRVRELEVAEAALAAAQTPPREPASRAQLEQRLGEALLFACSQARAAPAELIALVPLARGGAGAGAGGPCLAVLSRSGLGVVQPSGAPPLPPPAVAAGGAPLRGWGALMRAAGSVALDALRRVGVRESEWSAAVLAEAADADDDEAAAPAARVVAVGERLAAMYDNAAGTGAGGGGAAAAAGVPAEWYEPWGGATAGLPSAAEVAQLAEGAVAALAQPPEWAGQWHAALLGGWWLRGEQPASLVDPSVLDLVSGQPAASAAQARWLSASAVGSTREAARLCRGVLLLQQLTRPAAGAPSAAGALSAAAATLLAHELLLWLLLAPPAAAPAADADGGADGGADGAIVQLLLSAAIPSQLPDGSPSTLDGSQYARCLVAYVQYDVRLAEEEAAAADGGNSSAMAVDGAAEAAARPPSMALLLAAAGLWRPLHGYLRRLGSAARLHRFLRGQALLRELRVGAAVAAFEAAAEGASAAQLGALLAAARLEEPPREEPPPTAPSAQAAAAHQREWRLCGYRLGVRRIFREAGQTAEALRFCAAALEPAALGGGAPRLCASLLQEAFTLALQLGRTQEAHATLSKLHERGASERALQLAAAEADDAPAQQRHGARAKPYEDGRDDCTRALVSQLATRGALPRLGGLEFTGELGKLLHTALLVHARTSAVAPPWPDAAAAAAGAAAEVGAYEVAYALRVRAGDYTGGAVALYELAMRLQQAVGAEQAPRPAAALRRVLLRQAAALAGCLAALEQLPANERFLFDAARVRSGPSEAVSLQAALEAFELARYAADSRGLPLALPPSAELVFAEVRPASGGGGGELGGQRMNVETAAAEARAKLQRLRQAEAAGEAEETRMPLPVQVRELRQQRALALARAALLACGPSSEVGARVAGAGPGSVLAELLRRRAFAAAVPLALSFRVEAEADAAPDGPPTGLPLLVGELAMACAALAPGGEEEALLRALLREHDCEEANYELGAAAVSYWLHAGAAAAPLPSWLLDHFGAAPPQLAAPSATAAGGDAPPPPQVYRVTAAAGGEDGAAAAEARVRALLVALPRAGAALEVRGVLGHGGSAMLSVPRAAADAEAARQAQALVDQLYALDPGCRPARRNPAALCRALLRHPERQLQQALRQVRLGCEAGLADERCCWVTPKLIDDVHAEVARQQGVAPCSADGGAEGALQPELRACFAAIDTYYDHVVVGLPRAACLRDDPTMRRMVNYGEGWPEAPPVYLSAGAYETGAAAAPVQAEELFVQMLETSARWVEQDV